MTDPSMTDASSLVDDSEISPLDPLKPNRRLADVVHTEVIQFGRPKRVGILPSLPVLLSFAATAGTASCLIGWLLSRRVLSPSTAEESSTFRGALVAAEGRQQLLVSAGGNNDGTETTMYGLAISSVAVHVVSFTTPVVLGVCSYWFASLWIRKQQRGQNEMMPTPVQYGLLLGLCRSSGLTNAYDAARYMMQSRKKRPALSSILVSAFAVVAVMLFINYALSIADFWLHTTASTFTHTDITPVPTHMLPFVGSQLNTTLCPGPALVEIIPALEQGTNYSNCLHIGIESASAPEWFWGNAAVINEGAAVVQNRSHISQIIFVGDLAILAPKAVPADVDAVHFNTFGLKAECGPVTNCEVDTLEESILFCPAFNPPLNVSSLATGEVGSTVNQYNISNNAMIFDGEDGGSGYMLNSSLNPTGAQIMLYWATSPDTIDFPPADNRTGWYSVSRPEPTVFKMYIGTCTITAYNVSISYSAQNNGQFSLIGDAKLSNFNTTSALLAGLDPASSAILAQYLTSTLQASLNVSLNTFSAILSSNMSYALMGYAAPLFERTSAISGNHISQRIISRYPMAPLCTVLAILYGYALLLLPLCALPLLLVSQELIVVDPHEKSENSGMTGTHASSLIEHVRARIMNPLAGIVDQTSVVTAGQLLGTSNDEMLVESQHAERLGIKAVEDELDVDTGDRTYLLSHRVQRLKLGRLNE
ncbi:hypothetical protein DFH06DRAFT_1488584 [Mycena polygramma]|nr:hypothetical protein DFH06DRAFT_1488584 [Mycena polygramma]